MASITNYKHGHKMIQFFDADGKRRSLRLGRVSRRAAEAMKFRVESLVFALISGQSPDDETARWLANLDVVMIRKLNRVGLVSTGEVIGLKEFLDGYISSRHDAKPRTRMTYDYVRRDLLAFFGEGRRLNDITPGDAEEWRLSMFKRRVSENTVRRRCGVVKQFFNAACRRQVIAKNPFAGQSSSTVANVSHRYFISRREAELVLAACPDGHMRLLFALSRYGGLRCPSEPFALQWEHVHWDKNRVTIPSPKTEHHAGHESRVIPLFPELRPHLLAAFEAAPAGAEYVFQYYRDKKVDIRWAMLAVIRRAGLKPWPKLFQNLRSTRETELAEVYPLHVVCAWMGNSQPIAAKHYLQITEEHFEAAAAAPASPGE